MIIKNFKENAYTFIDWHPGKCLLKILHERRLRNYQRTEILKIKYAACDNEKRNYQ